jgi:S1-C subfamily serine protease
MVAMLEKNYVLLGYSSFNGPGSRASQVLSHATSIGAAAAVVYSKYSNTVSGTVPLVLPSQPTTSVSSVQGSVAGTGGYATYSGTATTTTYGGTTAYNLPYRIDRFDQFATFWAKGRPPILGVFGRDLSSEERAELERNGGVAIVAVMQGSAAFRANLLRGDIVLALNGVQVQDQQQFFGLLEPLAGTEVSLEIYRSGDRKTVALRLALPE